MAALIFFLKLKGKLVIFSVLHHQDYQLTASLVLIAKFSFNCKFAIQKNLMKDFM